MRVSASLGLVVLLASLVGCEQRNFDRCVVDSQEYQCEPGRFCKPIDGDPNKLGTCVTSECTAGAAVNGCPAASPVCVSGRCKACESDAECLATNADQPLCQTATGSLKGRCLQCMTPTSCAARSPKLGCDMSDGQCKPCTRHDQCAAQVCVKDETLNVSSIPVPMRLKTGDCVPASGILTVDVSPCPTCGTLQAQINAASIDKPYILVKTYDEKSPINVTAKADLPELHIVTGTADSSPAMLAQAPPATMHYQNMAIPLLTVHGGASLTLEGMLIYNSSTGIMCDSDNGAGTTVPTGLTVRRSIIGLTDQAIQTKPKCQLTLDQSYIGMGPASFGSFTGGNFLALNLDGTSFEIINSVFNHNVGMVNTAFAGITVSNSTSAMGLTGRIVNSTFYRHEPKYPGTGVPIPLAVQCSGTAVNLTVFNSLFVNTAAFPMANRTYLGSSCRSLGTFDYIATDESLPIAGAGPNLIAATESVLTAPQSGDLSLLKTAPSGVLTGGAKTLNGVAAPPVDVRGTTRGATKVSIGAFEVAP
jgi:hypothetical protein